MIRKPPAEEAEDTYLINGTYLSDVRLLFAAAGKDDILMMIKKGFVGLQDHPCEGVEDPVSWRDFLADGGATVHWRDIQCPFHKTLNGRCEEVTSLSRNNYPPCVILANYFTAKLILRPGSE